MLFRIDDRSISAMVEEHEPLVSRHSGRQLRRLTIRFRASDADRAEVLSALQKARKGEMVSEEAEPRRWKVENSSYSYTQVGDTMTHTWELCEFEELRVAELRIGKAVYHPYKYDEKFSESGLTITAHVRVSLEEASILNEQLMSVDPVKVVRVGLSEEPRDMNFGALPIWSSDADGRKYEFSLHDVVEEKQNSSIARVLQPHTTHMQREILLSSQVLTTLIRMLSEKGVLTPEQAAELRTVDVSLNSADMLSFRKVRDVDEWE